MSGYSYAIAFLQERRANNKHTDVELLDSVIQHIFAYSIAFDCHSCRRSSSCSAYIKCVAHVACIIAHRVFPTLPASCIDPLNHTQQTVSISPKCLTDLSSSVEWSPCKASLKRYVAGSVDSDAGSALVLGSTSPLEKLIVESRSRHLINLPATSIQVDNDAHSNRNEPKITDEIPRLARF